VVWSLVLLQGFALANVHIEIPWYETPEATLHSSSKLEAGVQLGNVAHAQETRELPVLKTNNTDWAAYLFMAWIAVCGLLLFRWCMDYVRFVLRENSPECDCDEWNTEWETVKSNCRVSARITLHISQHIGPMLCRRPSEYRVVVPYKLWKSATTSQRQLILRHELAHFQRGDVWWSLIAHVAAIPHWFNPLAWYAARRVEQSLEWACDDKTIAFKCQRQTEYASVLLAISEYCSSSVPKCVTGINGSELGGRIRRLLSDSWKRDKLSSRTLAVLVAVVLLGGQLFRVDLVAQQPKAVDGVAQQQKADEIKRTDEEMRLLHLMHAGKRVYDPTVLSETEEDDLALTGPLITDDELIRFLDNIGVDKLTFFDTKVTGPGLQHLNKLIYLEELVLIGPEVTNEWLANLPDLPALRRVTICQTNVADSGLLHLKRFPKLKTLDLRYTDLHDAALGVLEHLPNLRHLYLGSTQVGDDALANLRFTPGLTRLGLKHTEVTDEGLEQLRHVPYLVYFSLASRRVKGPGTANLKYLKRLGQLQFVGENVSDEWLRGIPALTELYWLQLYGTSITSAGLKPVGAWTKLEKLYLSNNNKIDDEVTAYLVGLNRLETLELHETSVTSEAADTLQKNLPLAQIPSLKFQRNTSP